MAGRNPRLHGQDPPPRAARTQARGPEDPSVTSAGRATAARAAYEARVRRQTRAALNRDLLALLQQSGSRDHYTPPIMGEVLQVWDLVTATLLRALSLPATHASEVRTRLSQSSYPARLLDLLSDNPGAPHTQRERLRQARDSLDRLIRTEATTAYNQHSLDLIRRSPDLPLKRWVAHHDKITRPSHLRADGQTVPQDAQFAVGSTMLQHPGDTLGPPEEVANCRCVLVGVPAPRPARRQAR